MSDAGQAATESMCSAAHGLSLRSAEPADLPALLALEQASFTGDRLTARSFRRWLARQPCPVLVVTPAASAQRLCGYAVLLLSARGRSARLYSLAVATSARGRGVGGLLLDACGQRARDAGCVELRLEVSVHNAAAIRLYLRAGFHLYQRRHAYYEDGSDALCLRRSLQRDHRPGAASLPVG